MSLLSKIKPAALLETFISTFKRFKVAVGLIFVETIYLIFLILSGYRTEEWNMVIHYFLLECIVLSVALKLWFERGVKEGRFKMVSVIAYFILLAVSVYLYGGVRIYDGEMSIAHISLIFSLIMASAILPFNKEKDDVSYWNFLLKQSVNYAFSVFIGLILFAGVSLFLSSFYFLFDINVDEDFYYINAVLSLFTLPTLLFLALVSFGDEMFNFTDTLSKVYTSAIRYIVLPLLILYLIILYVYGLKILVTMSLPCGWVSTLIITLVMSMIVVIILLYPLAVTQRKRTETFIYKVMPALVLPLLVLFSIAIGRRVADYGLTVSRVYVLVINLWFYFVCLYLLCSKTVRIKWIIISFCLFFVIFSVGPLSAVNITRRVLYSDVKEIIGKYSQVDTALTTDDYDNLLSKMEIKDAYRLNDKLRYMTNSYESIRDERQKIISSDNIQFYRFNDKIRDRERKENVDSEDRSFEIEYCNYKGAVEILSGYKYIYYVDRYFSDCDIVIGDGMAGLEIRVDGNEEKFIFEFPTNMLWDVYQQKIKGGATTEEKPLQIKDKTGKAVLVLFKVSGEYKQNIDKFNHIIIKGSMFFNR